VLLELDDVLELLDVVLLVVVDVVPIPAPPAATLTPTPANIHAF
jgi:hypothetical protein